MADSNKRDAYILLIEAFYGGSHKQLMDLLLDEFQQSAKIFTLPAKKWHWRALTSALYFAEVIPKVHKFKFLFTSSILPLAELVALRPDLGKLYKIVYFHENQMAYPVQIRKDRYFQHSYNEVLTSLVADKILFNSCFNMESFLSSISSCFNIIPSHRPKNLRSKIEPKSSVLYFPIILLENSEAKIFPELSKTLSSIEEKCLLGKIDLKCFCAEHSDVTFGGTDQKTIRDNSPSRLHIIWPHRWEHDKDPDTFFSILFRLKEEGAQFILSVIGESYSEKPKIFEEAKLRLKKEIINWGFKETKVDYYRVLLSADVVVSTALHEFFGVSMLEATSSGCYPLCPKALAYPEIYPEEYLYNTPNQLYKKLRYFCQKPQAVRNHTVKVDTTKFSWDVLRQNYVNLFC